MNQMQTIGIVSKSLGISSRMLRYYEQVGLIESKRMDDYVYRVYDEKTISRLRQIIILRKLRVPVKQIREIFGNSDAVDVIEIFERNISELDEQITALSTVKSILSRLVQELHEKANMHLQLNYLGDNSVFAIVDSISFPKNTIQEEQSMSELNQLNQLNQASEKITKLTDHEVRIINLPPMTIAAFCATGENCEGKAGDAIDQFVKESRLLEIKPDARSFGFDCSEQFQGIGVPSQRYEVWVSIPDEIEVPADFKKFKFDGGLYAAHVLMNWDFEMWRYLAEWVDASSKFDHNVGEQPCFEERLNYFNIIQNETELQLDLLFPIKLKPDAI